MNSIKDRFAAAVSEVTRDDVRSLRDSAGDAGDTEAHAIAVAALRGDADAWREAAEMCADWALRSAL